MAVNWGSVGSGAMSGATAGASFGPWGAVIGGVIGAGAGYLSSSQQEEAAKNAGAGGPAISLPSFYTDPYYTSKQAELSDYSSGMLKGDMPDYYKAIGANNSPEFQDVLNMTTRDIQRNTLESAAKMGTRGGAVNSILAKTTADTAKQLRFADLERALSGRQYLLGVGSQMATGVRDSALSYGSQRNQFNLGLGSLGLASAGFTSDEEQRAQATDQAKGAGWSSILSSGIGALGNLKGAGAYSDMAKSYGSASVPAATANPSTSGNLYSGMNTGLGTDLLNKRYR